MKGRAYGIIQVLLSPICILALLSSKRIHPSYQMTIWRKLKLGYRFYLNRLRVPTITSPKVHLAMALKLLEMPPNLPGVVVECGTYKECTSQPSLS